MHDVTHLRTHTYSFGRTALWLACANQHEGAAAELASTDEVKAVFAELVEHAVITDDNKNALLLDCARLGLVSRLRAVLQAGANAAHADEVRVGA